jgi:hypothetical protein
VTAAELIGRLAALGASIRVTGSDLALRAPAGVITPELRAELARNKPQLLAALGERSDTDRQAICAVAAILARAYQRCGSIPRLTPSRDAERMGEQLAFVRQQSVHGGAQRP